MDNNRRRRHFHFISLALNYLRRTTEEQRRIARRTAIVTDFMESHYPPGQTVQVCYETTIPVDRGDNGNGKPVYDRANHRVLVNTDIPNQRTWLPVWAVLPLTPPNPPQETS